MTLLERFRAQPRQKHADPAVRLGFVQEIPMSERELLVEIAREDADPRIRRAAVAKLLDPPALGAIASSDADASVREQAAAMLRDIALEAFEGIGEPESLAAVDALTDAKSLATIAKSAASQTVADRARARVDDPHALGSIARHAEHESVRRAAFASLDDEREILSVALNSEFRDPALAAVDAITDRAELEQIASRARNKHVAKRARTIVREFEEREARDREAAEEAAKAAADAERAARLESARSEAEAREEAERHAAEATRSAAAEAAAAADTERARQQAERDRERLEAEQRDAARHHARQKELADDATRVAAMEDMRAAVRQFSVIRREWSSLAGQAAPEPETLAQYGQADAAFVAREHVARESEQQARREALTRLQQLVARVEPLAAREDLTLKNGERALRDVRAALGAMPSLPSKQDHDEVLGKLKAALSALTPKVQELREVAGWQRWANVGIQEQLVEKMEALKTLDDPEQVARQVKELQQQWRQAADVPRAQGEALWRRFKAAHDEVWTKCEAHFAAQAEVRADNLTRKLALCERVEGLADSTNWIQTAEEIKKLQAEWKTIGAVSRGQEKAIWERFRTACDRFFTRRHTDLAERKTVWSANLTKKEALITQVQALADSTDWDKTAAEIKRIQSEWKTIGPVKKSRSEALWQRFRAACDQFFTRYAQRHEIARGERVAARESIVAELEALTADVPAPAEGEATGSEAASAAQTHPPQAAEEAPADLAAKVRSIRGRWQQELAARGVDRGPAAALDERFAAAFARVIARWPQIFTGTDLDPESNRRRMETIVKRMEELAGSVAGSGDMADAAASPSRLAAMLKEALAANTIGGKADHESKLRAATDEVRQAQANWSRIGPVPDDVRRALADRFQRAIRRIADKAGDAGRGGRVPVGAGGPSARARN
ncbi:MAG TPA: DUF349 domain-containing protein [Vicinamibacterales bacterium]|jgi:hypothetical protein